LLGFSKFALLEPGDCEGMKGAEQHRIVRIDIFPKKSDRARRECFGIANMSTDGQENRDIA
jgi:hypothetical protein